MQHYQRWRASGSILIFIAGLFATTLAAQSVEVERSDGSHLVMR